jgi:hypothetical protein
MGDTVVRRRLEWLVDSWPDIKQPLIETLAPNGGETFQCGQECEIEWNASDNTAVTSIDILLSRDSGASFPDTIATGESNDSLFVWLVPDSVSSSSRIRIIARDAAGLAQYDDSDGDFSTDIITEGPGNPDPGPFVLSQNIPNPFNPVTLIGFGLSEPANVRLQIYDAEGKLVKTLVDEFRQARVFNEKWDGLDNRGRAVASGIYFYRLVAGDFEQTRKMVLLR